jgi:hypothetical protein
MEPGGVLVSSYGPVATLSIFCADQGLAPRISAQAERTLTFADSLNFKPRPMRGFFFAGRSARRRAAFVRALAMLLRQHNTQRSFAGMGGRARIQPEAERTVACAHGLWGNCMGETLLLLSCGAAFITGIVIAAVSLFG